MEAKTSLGCTTILYTCTKELHYIPLPPRLERGLKQMAVDKKTVIQNIVVSLLVAAGLFFSVLLLNYSWIKLLLVALILAGGIVWLVTRGNLKRNIKYFVLVLMIFGIGFTSFERYIFWNAGYPSTYRASEPTVTISYPSILNVSLTEVVQSAEKTDAFSLFNVEHPGKITFEFIGLHTSFAGGRIEVGFYNEATNTELGFISSDGYPYHASIIPWIGKPPSRIYSQQVPPEESLKQIDDLGLQWFYDSVSEIYQNRTGNNPNTVSLEVSTQWQEYGEYKGMILQMTAWQWNGDRIQDSFNVAFQPDGTLLYLNIPK